LIYRDQFGLSINSYIIYSSSFLLNVEQYRIKETKKKLGTGRQEVTIILNWKNKKRILTGGRDERR